MPKTLLVFVFGPLLLVAAVLVSPFAFCYFCFDRACDCIEHFKPHSRRRKQGSRAKVAKQLAGVLNRIPPRESSTPANKSV